MASAGGSGVWSNLSRRMRRVRGHTNYMTASPADTRWMIDLSTRKSWPSKHTTRRRRRRKEEVQARPHLVANTKFGILMRWALFLEPLRSPHTIPSRSRSRFHFADLCGHCRLRHRDRIWYFYGKQTYTIFMFCLQKVPLSLSLSRSLN